jgi:hypothetical protein
MELFKQGVNKPKRCAENAFLPQKQSHTKKKTHLYRNFDYVSLPTYNINKLETIEIEKNPQIHKFATGKDTYKSNPDENKWVYLSNQKRMATFPKYSDQVILLGEPLGHLNYFRAFTNNISVPKLVKENRIETLLPHRPKKTLRLYGVTPLVLLGKGKPTSPVQKWKEKVKKVRSEAKEPDRRIDGPEIAPNMADIDEFVFNEEK